MKIIVTGGAGFIGSNLIHEIIATTDYEVINIDCLTYAGNLTNLDGIDSGTKYQHINIDIRDGQAIHDLVARINPDAIIHLAAESHVDRSIDGPSAFIHTNVLGTYHLLEAFRSTWNTAPEPKRSRMRFLHVSTDEVYGSLGENGLFTESTPYQPNSPYSASKASSDHLVRAWFQTYGLPTMTSNCSNNYGPRQDLEKLIPKIIFNAYEGKNLPVYGQGENIRDWLYVKDHVKALLTILDRGQLGECYNVGGLNEWRNIDVVHEICQLVDKAAPSAQYPDRKDLVTFVKDRPGHDERYAIDASKIASELGWRPEEDFKSGLTKTVAWYLDQSNPWCIQAIQDPSRRERLGLGGANSA